MNDKRERVSIFDKVAFAKGRGTSECIRLFETDGFRAPEAFHGGRLTVHSEMSLSMMFLIVRGNDLPGLLDEGWVDMGIGSRLIFEEAANDNLCQVADLDIERCRLSVITKDERPLETITHVCTHYPRTAARCLSDRGYEPRISKLHGCLEIALVLGMCDAIVDVVETGWTIDNLKFHENTVLLPIQHTIWMPRRSLTRLAVLRHCAPSVHWDDQVLLACADAGAPPSHPANEQTHSTYADQNT